MSESEKQALQHFTRFVEKKALAAADERTRFIRLMVLALTEVAMKIESVTAEEAAAHV